MTQANPTSLPIKTTLLVASTLTVMAGATIAPSLPAMQSYFSEVDNVEYLVKLVLTIPALFIVIGGPIAGILVDRLGRKPLLAASTIIYGFAGSSGFILNSLGSILVGRAFLGIAVAGIMTSTTTLIADYYLGQARANFLGLQAAFMGLGGVFFLSGGGFLADINWRIPFLIYLFAWASSPLVLIFIYEPERDRHQQKNTIHSQTSQVALPLKLLVVIYAVALLMQVIFYLIPVQLPFYLQLLTNASATQSGMAIALTTVFSSFGSMIYGRVKAHLDFVIITAISFGLMGVGYTIIGFADSYSLVLVGLAVAGLGLGFLMPNLNVWLSTEVPNTVRGRALGGLTAFFFLGQFLSPSIAQPLSERVGLGITYALAGGLLLFAGLVFAGMKQQIVALTDSSYNKA